MVEAGGTVPALPSAWLRPGSEVTVVEEEGVTLPPAQPLSSSLRLKSCFFEGERLVQCSLVGFRVVLCVFFVR